ncbi:Hypothetical protein GbCGDNIH1_8042 [Granulibacter bethesdensis CGDNIH1]|uniref:Uncharacterized protein n=1 Tax=Granulibacter bethesdensis (strain ATCC BAA-1260 / CGDNIH1) TaxID=391165 RepID=A0A286M2T6_GRABC|nr:Hypothetical protein GbCGDNIH5_8042 [Granulibacter bethesdensis]APH63408.1 Hypothetical protein GbCGDNIH1I4_8042 [Granulibacter bethesdensis]ASV62335.1 Hypothetical protein GbCGDNIH1_8042 [Granulibacter bethesdensis CGDNIH1]
MRKNGFAHRGTKCFTIEKNDLLSHGRNPGIEGKNRRLSSVSGQRPRRTAPAFMMEDAFRRPPSCGNYLPFVR